MMKGRNLHIPTVKASVKTLSQSAKTETVKAVIKVDGKTVITSQPTKLPK